MSMDLRSRTIIPLLFSIPLLVAAGVSGAAGNRGLLFILLAAAVVLISEIGRAHV